MTVTVLLGQAPNRAVRFGVSPLAELTATMHAVVESAHHPAQRASTSRLRDALPHDLAALFYAYSPLWGTYRSRFLLPGPIGLDATLERELDAIMELPLAEFTLLAAYGISGGYTGRSFVDLAASEAARHELRQRAVSRGSTASWLCEALVADADGFRDSLVDVLRRCGERYLAQEWQRSGPLFRRESLRQRDRARLHGHASALLDLAPATTREDNPDRLRFDMFHHGFIDLDRQDLLVVPSIMGSPHVLIKHEAGWPAILQYPVRPADGPGSIEQAMISRRLTVLSNPGYQRLARLLAAEPLPTVEIARRFGISSAQVSRQLRVFRDIGIVASSREGSYVFYRLDLDQVSRLGADLLHVLLR